MCDEASARAPNETGGVLLGVAAGSTVWIEVVIGPGPNALHRRGYFVPDADYHQQQIATAYERSGRRLAYLGDWHTHPGMSAYLSGTDYKTLRAIGRYIPARQVRPIMAVLGHEHPWELCVWRLQRRPWYSVRRSVECLNLIIE